MSTSLFYPTTIKDKSTICLHGYASEFLYLSQYELRQISPGLHP
ncbi:MULTISPECIES: hypothetical protein [Bacteroides]|nr:MULTISPECIES: hypothetical protein [Bacteroides]MDU6394126.1 hypothetical protein [Bacteroides sp.]